MLKHKQAPGRYKHRNLKMPETLTSVGVNTPHDKLFREILSDLNNARSFLQHRLRKDLLSLIDLNSLAICKDSFIEKELAD